MNPGINYAVGAQQRIGWLLSEEGNRVSIDRLEQALPDGGTKGELRTAVAYLAAQVWAERNATGAARAADATRIISVLEREVDWWRDRETTREAP